MLFQCVNSQYRRQPCSTNSHCLAAVHTLWQWHQPVSLDSGFLRITAPMRLTDTPPGQHDGIPRLVSWIIRFLNYTRKVNSGHMGVVPHQSSTRTNAQAVFVIYSRIFNGNRDIPLR